MSARDDLEARVWLILTTAPGHADPMTFAAIIEAAVTYRTALEPCASCGRPQPERAWLENWACGYCGTCYKRWRRHGSPPEGPPPPSRRAPRASHVALLEDYAELRSWGVQDEEAAQRLGVSPRTIERYKHRREMAGTS